MRYRGDANIVLICVYVCMDWCSVSGFGADDLVLRRNPLFGTSLSPSSYQSSPLVYDIGVRYVRRLFVFG
jgi:hypothetical protein